MIFFGFKNKKQDKNYPTHFTFIKIKNLCFFVENIKTKMY